MGTLATGVIGSPNPHCWRESEPLLLVCGILHVSFVTADTSHTGVGTVAEAETATLCGSPGFTFPHHWRLQEQRAADLEMEKTRSLTSAVLYKKTKPQTNEPTCGGLGNRSSVWSKSQEWIRR